MDLGALWTLTRTFHEHIKLTAMLPEWSQSIDGQPPVSLDRALALACSVAQPKRLTRQVKDGWQRTDFRSVRSVVNAICVLRAHTQNLKYGPVYNKDGSPLPDTPQPEHITRLRNSAPPEPASPSAAASSSSGDAASSLAPLLRPQEYHTSGNSGEVSLCGINGCVLASGHQGLCVIDPNHDSLATKRRVQQTDFLAPEGCAPTADAPAPAPTPAPKHKASSAAAPRPRNAEPSLGRQASDDAYPLEPPPGWTVENRETQTGRKYKVYHCRDGLHKEPSLKQAWIRHRELESKGKQPKGGGGAVVAAPQRRPSQDKQPDAARSASPAAARPQPGSGASAARSQAPRPVVPPQAPNPPGAPANLDVAAQKARVDKLIDDASKFAKDNDFESAHRAYTELLEELPSELLQTDRRTFYLVNRAFVRYKLGQHAQALQDANAALGLDDLRPTAFWRKVQALDGLEQTETADVRHIPSPTLSPLAAPRLTSAAGSARTWQAVALDAVKRAVRKNPNKQDKYWDKIVERDRNIGKRAAAELETAITAADPTRLSQAIAAAVRCSSVDAALIQKAEAALEQATEVAETVTGPTEASEPDDARTYRSCASAGPATSGNKVGGIVRMDGSDDDDDDDDNGGKLTKEQQATMAAIRAQNAAARAAAAPAASAAARPPAPAPPPAGSLPAALAAVAPSAPAPPAPAPNLEISAPDDAAAEDMEDVEDVETQVGEKDDVADEASLDVFSPVAENAAAAAPPVAVAEAAGAAVPDAAAPPLGLQIPTPLLVSAEAAAAGPSPVAQPETPEVMEISQRSEQAVEDPASSEEDDVPLNQRAESASLLAPGSRPPSAQQQVSPPAPSPPAVSPTPPASAPVPAPTYRGCAMPPPTALSAPAPTYRSCAMPPPTAPSIPAEASKPSVADSSSGSDDDEDTPLSSRATLPASGGAGPPPPRRPSLAPPPSMQPPISPTQQLSQARTLLLDIEDHIDMDHVNVYMQRNLVKWRNKVKKATTLKDLSTQMRELRQCILDEYKGRTLFRRGYTKGAELYTQWRQSAQRGDITYEVLHALLTQLWKSYVQSGENDGVISAPAAPAPAMRAPAKPRPAKPRAAAPAPSRTDKLVTPESKPAAASAAKATAAAPAAKERAPSEESAAVQQERPVEQKKTAAHKPRDAVKMEELRSLLGDGPSDKTLQSLLSISGGDVSAAANAFFDGSTPQASSSGGGGDEVDLLVSDAEQQSGTARKRLVKGGAVGRAPVSSHPAASTSSAPSVSRADSSGETQVKRGAWKEAEPWPLEDVLKMKFAKLDLWWAGNRCWFSGKIVDVDEKKNVGKVLIKYTDGEWKWHYLHQEAYKNVKLKQPKAPPRAEPSQQPAPAPAPAPAHVPSEQKAKIAPPADKQAQSGAEAQAARPPKRPAASRPESKPSKAKAPAKMAGGGTAAEAKAGSSAPSTKPARKEAAAAQKPREPLHMAPAVAIGRKTQPPRYLQSGFPCTCGGDKECADFRCSNYEYYDAMRMTSEYGHTSQTPKEGKGVVNFYEGTGMIMRDDADSNGMVAELGGVRQNKNTGKVECLARWFVRANDHQIQSDVGEESAKPAALVYRIGGEQQDQWQADWCTSESVIGKCKTSYAPPAIILQHCETAAKRGWKREFYFDSHIVHDGSKFNPPQQLPQSRRVQDAKCGDEPTAAQMLAAESSSDEEDLAPLSRRVTPKPKRPAPTPQTPLRQGEAGTAKRYRIKRNKQAPVSFDHPSPRRGSVKRPADDEPFRKTPWQMPGQSVMPISVDVPEMAPEHEAAEGCGFEHIVRPEAGDTFAGAFYELGLSRAPPVALRPLVTTAELAGLRSPRGASGALIEQGKRLVAAAGWNPWDAVTVPEQLRGPPASDCWERQAPSLAARAPFDNRDTFRPYLGRFFPILLTRLGADGRQRYMERKEPPLMCPVVERVLRETSGKGRTPAADGEEGLTREGPAYAAIRRGVALEPTLGVPTTSWAWPAGDRRDGGKRRGDRTADDDGLEAFETKMFETRNAPMTAELDQMRRRLHSDKRSMLNGTLLNRFKYTSYSRHFTSHRVLEAIAFALQPHLRPGDTFVDFACGLNTFAPLLKDPATGEALNAVAFDLFSPVDRTEHFTRTAWLQVDAERDLPPGELVIGLNPPFGHQNRTAIDFVEHALCARPRLLVLIMPSTNYEPPGYELLERDEQLCRGNVFYTPGKTTANIDAKARALAPPPPGPFPLPRPHPRPRPMVDSPRPCRASAERQAQLPALPAEAGGRAAAVRPVPTQRQAPGDGRREGAAAARLRDEAEV